MKKSTTKFSTFRSRTGSDSTKAFQGGRVEVLPPEAIEFEISVDSLAGQFAQIKASVENLQKQIRAAGSKDEKARLQERLMTVQSHLGDIGRTLKLAKEERRAWVFYRVCRHLLTQQTFKKIDMEVDRILESRGGHK